MDDSAGTLLLLPPRDDREVDGVGHGGVARLGCSLSPGPPVEEFGWYIAFTSPVALSSVAPSKSITPSKILAEWKNAFSALRLASTSGRPWVGVLLSAEVSVAA